MKFRNLKRGSEIFFSFQDLLEFLKGTFVLNGIVQTLMEPISVIKFEELLERLLWFCKFEELIRWAKNDWNQTTVNISLDFTESWNSYCEYPHEHVSSQH
jgi:hypothetical protein